MALVANAVANNYALRNALIKAEKAVEALLLVSNPGELADAQAAVNALINTIGTTAAGSASTGATSMVISSGVEFLSPLVSGTRVDGYTPTIVNGAITVLVGS